MGAMSRASADRATVRVVGCLIVFCSVVCGTSAAAPLIVRVDPSEFVASSVQQMRVVMVRGYRIWEAANYDDYQKRVAVFVRREGAFQSVPTFGYGYWSDQKELTLNIPQVPWFATPGTFEVMVKVDGKESNYFQVPVLEGPPSIDKVTPSTVTLSGDASADKSQEIRIVASNMGSPMELSVLLDGKPLDRYLLGPGVLTAFIPESVFKKSAKLGLQVKSSAGLSEPFPVTLTLPPVKLQESLPALKLAPVQPGALPIRRRGQ